MVSRNTMANYVVVVNRMLDGGFVAKASNLKPKPSILYLEAQINAKNVSCMSGQKDNALLHKAKDHKGIRTCKGIE